MVAMEIIKIVSIGFTAVLLGAVLKQRRPEFAIELSLAAALIIFWLLASKLSEILQLFTRLATKAGIGPAYLYILFKIVAVAYITEFGVQLCRDAGENAIAAKLEIAGKLLVIAAALPIIELVMETIMKFME